MKKPHVQGRFASVPVELRFWEKVCKYKEENACWGWLADKNVHGYGTFDLNGKSMLAHRVSWILTYGDFPRELCILHHCDNAACVRPNHLFIGTRQDNSDDMFKKHRERHDGLRGKLNGMTKLTKEQVREIRKRYKEDVAISQLDLAQVYSVTQSTIRRAISGETWGWLK